MTAFIALVLVAIITWLYRISFTALLDGQRLPAAVRQRMDAVAPAAFAALVAARITGTAPGDVLPIAAACLAAGLVAWRGASHVAAVGAAAAAWWLCAAV